MVLPPEIVAGPTELQVPGWTATYPASAELETCGADQGAFETEGGTTIDAVPLPDSLALKVNVNWVAEPAVADGGASETPSIAFGAAKAAHGARTHAMNMRTERACHRTIRRVVERRVEPLMWPPLPGEPPAVPEPGSSCTPGRCSGQEGTRYRRRLDVCCRCLMRRTGQGMRRGGRKRGKETREERGSRTTESRSRGRDEIIRVRPRARRPYPAPAGRRWGAPRTAP